jgi:hypothetical protein
MSRFYWVKPKWIFSWLAPVFDLLDPEMHRFHLTKESMNSFVEELIC